jgi:hypothetical protein
MRKTSHAESVSYKATESKKIHLKHLKFSICVWQNGLSLEPEVGKLRPTASFYSARQRCINLFNQ